MECAGGTAVNVYDKSEITRAVDMQWFRRSIALEFFPPPKSSVVNTSASVDILARFSWKWRRKFRPMDSLVLVSRGTPCSCNGNPLMDPAMGSTPVRFHLADIIRVAARINDPVSDEMLIAEICPRISSAQLELQVNVFERRRAKYVNENEATGTLAQTSYPVTYSSATIPLFFAPTSSSALASSFLFTPGKYEFRLGIQAVGINFPRDLPDPPVELPSRTVMALEGGRPTSPNGDHRIAFVSPSSTIASRLKNHACTSRDQYTEWPHLNFRVSWGSTIPSPFGPTATFSTISRFSKLLEMFNSLSAEVKALSAKLEGSKHAYSSITSMSVSSSYPINPSASFEIPDPATAEAITTNFPEKLGPVECERYQKFVLPKESDDLSYSETNGGIQQNSDCLFRLIYNQKRPDE
ncbi:hypothetical protein ACTXT7_005412 [Hymenolepis weldensis]